MTLKPEKTKKRKWADASRPLLLAADTNKKNKKNDLTASAFASRPLPLAETKKKNFSTFAAAGVASVASVNKDSNFLELNNTAETDIEDTTTHALVSNKIMVPRSSTRTALERYKKVVKDRQWEREKEREAARKSLLKIEEEAAAANSGDNHQLFKEMDELCGWTLPEDYSPPPSPSPSRTTPYLERRFGLKLIPRMECE